MEMELEMEMEMEMEMRWSRDRDADEDGSGDGESDGSCRIWSYKSQLGGNFWSSGGESRSQICIGEAIGIRF